MEHYAKFDVHAAQRHVAPAVLGFFRSVALGQASGRCSTLNTGRFLHSHTV